MLTRRRFLTTAAIGLATPALFRRTAAFAAAGGPPLPALAVIDATATNAFSLAATPGEMSFAGGAATPTLGFNGAYLGPLVRVRSGSSVAASVANRTDRTVSVHWHGLLVPGAVDGGPHQPIAPGATWNPTLPVAQAPATLWYHTHIHGQTGAGVHAGLAGVLLVTDGRDGERGLPAATGLDDLVLVLQDKRLDASGRAAYAPGPADRMHGFLGNTAIVNGVAQPVARVPAGIVRLRLLNGANGRNFDLSFADGRAFALVATDQGYLPLPPTLDRLRLAPGERAEILVDFGSDGDGTLLSRPHGETRGTMPAGHMMAGMHDALPVPETFAAPFPLLAFVVDPGLPAAVRALPASLDGADAALPAPVAERRFVMNDMGMPGAAMAAPSPGGMGHGAMDHGGMGHGGMGHGSPDASPMGGADGATAGGMPPSDLVFTINGRPFDMGRIDAEVAAGTTERWIVSGQMMGHPFHVHGARFRVESENGGPPRPENAGWKDTVFVEGEAVLAVRFDHPADAAKPFMFHCHILEHEDAGMMGQFAVA